MKARYVTSEVWGWRITDAFSRGSSAKLPSLTVHVHDRLHGYRVIAHFRTEEVRVRGCGLRTSGREAKIATAREQAAALVQRLNDDYVSAA